MRTLDDVFDQPHTLPTISHVAYELIDLSRDDDADLAQVIACVKRDQAIAAKVIRVANSSFYGERGRISSVDRAVSILGLQTLRTTVLTSAVMSAFPAVAGIDMPAYWTSVLTSALLASDIALWRGLPTDTVDAAFTAGLMQGLGVLLIHLRLPQEASQIALQVDPLDLRGRIFVEEEVLGFSHCLVTAELLSRWRFPEEISSAVREYPQPPKSDLICNILALSTAMALHFEDDLPNVQMPEVCQRAIELLNIPKSLLFERRNAMALTASSVVLTD